MKTMKLLLNILLICLSTSYSQTKEIKFNIDNNSSIIFSTLRFDPSKHSLEFDKTGNLLLIDSSIFYGCSYGLPYNLLEKAVLVINGKEIILDTKGITNLYLENDSTFRLNEKGFIDSDMLKLKKINDDSYVLRIGFSDGADACVVIYDIRKQCASRILLISDLDYAEYGLEKYFFNE